VVEALGHAEHAAPGVVLAGGTGAAGDVLPMMNTLGRGAFPGPGFVDGLLVADFLAMVVSFLF
jgi:hypothetical protein